MKSLFALLAAMMLTFVLVACGGQDTESTTPTEEAATTEEPMAEEPAPMDDMAPMDEAPAEESGDEAMDEEIPAE